MGQINTSPQSGRQEDPIPNPTPTLPKTPEVEKGQGVKSVKIPSFREFSSRQFDSQVKVLLTKLGAESPYFKEAADTAVKKGYTFQMYTPQLRPGDDAFNRDMQSGNYGAFTFHDEKKVVINLEALQREARRLARPESEQLLKCLANESMHIVCGSTFTMYDEPGAAKAFDAVKAYDSPWSAAELSYQQAFVEELASKVAETTIRRQLSDPDFEFTRSDLQAGRHYYSDMKAHYREEVYSRVFAGADIEGRNKSAGEELVIRRIDFFMKNGGVDQRVAALLEAHGLMKKEKQ